MQKLYAAHSSSSTSAMVKNDSRGGSNSDSDGPVPSYGVLNTQSSTDQAHTPRRHQKLAFADSDEQLQIPPIRSIKLQQMRHAAVSQTKAPAHAVTYDSYYHNSTLRVVNSELPTPRRRTVREVYAQYGETHAKPRLGRTVQSPKLHARHRPVEVTDGAEPRFVLHDDLGPFEPLDKHQQKVEDFEEAYARGVRFEMNFRDPQGNSIDIKRYTPRMGMAEEQLRLIRNGSGRRARLRREVLELLGVRRD